MSEEQQKKDPTRMKVKLRWEENNDLPIVFANQMILNHAAIHEFVMVFGQIQIPVSPDAGTPTEVHVAPVAKLIIPASRMKEFVELININWAAYQDKGYLPNEVRDDE